VFTQTTTNQKGRPIRDPASTTYTGAIETAELFGRRIYTEAWERGWSRAKITVVLGDGAEGGSTSAVHHDNVKIVFIGTGIAGDR
jgi:hypothetical protein